MLASVSSNHTAPYIHAKTSTNVTRNLALGFLITLYATLITLFGLAWVLFLIGMAQTPLTC